MNVKNQLILNTQQFVKCFFADDKFFAVRLIVFIVTGLSAFWFSFFNKTFTNSGRRVGLFYKR